VAGAGLPTMADLTDPRVSSSRELETLLQMPVLGGSDGQRERSNRDILRRIALSILRERRQAGTRVFVVTAVSQGSGTSTLTLTLANELGELGASAVAVEANALSPDMRYRDSAPSRPELVRESANGSLALNGKPSGPPINGAVAKRSPLSVCIHSIMSAANLLPDRMSICPLQKDQRLSMRCVQEALELGLASHDLVLMDAPPVLNSADTAMLVQNPAGVLVVVRSRHDRLTDVLAAIAELHKLSPPVIGVVLSHDRIDDERNPKLSESRKKEIEKSNYPRLNLADEATDDRKIDSTSSSQIGTL
jgi:Mrp family chromosome partitioning ATPase